MPAQIWRNFWEIRVSGARVAGFVRDRTIPPFKVLPANDS